jgi:hypothetical protein
VRPYLYNAEGEYVIIKGRNLGVQVLDLEQQVLVPPNVTIVVNNVTSGMSCVLPHTPAIPEVDA